jgi:DNA-binding Lrp family transcriptional regulator
MKSNSGGIMMNEFKLSILDLLKEDARLSAATIATMLGAVQEDVSSAIAEMERDHVIVKYATIVNWSKVDDEKVTALIEVECTPERGRGFENIAERVYLYPEVKSVYLMSGAYDLLVEIEGKNLKEVASFVSNKLSTIESVISTKSFFILKKYKQDGIIFEEFEDDHRLLVSP